MITQYKKLGLYVVTTNIWTFILGDNMDKAELKKLQGLLPLANDYLVEYTPDEYNDIDESLRPTFILAPWTANQIKQLAKLGSDDNAAMIAIAKQIRGWKNLKRLTADNELVDIQWEKNDNDVGVKKALINEIPTKIVVSIMKELSRISGA